MIYTNTYLLPLLKNAPADIRERVRTTTARQGEALFIQGEPPKMVYILRDGLAKVSILEANGKEFSVAFLGKGELIGEVEAFSGLPFGCTVTPLTDISAYRLSNRLFLEWIERDRELNRLIVKEMAFRLYALSTRTSFQMAYPAEYAIMKILHVSQNGNVNITKTDLAGYVGITIRSLNRSLNHLKEKGILQFTNNTLSVCSQERLRQELIQHEYA
jgi:CRP-like cAMP-binding protein